MKKIALILAVVCVVAIVAGCGGGDEPAAPQAAQATVETTPAMSSQEARAEFLRLYDALQGFRNDRQFKEVGFGTCCKYHQWIVDMKKLHNGPSSKVLFDEYQVMTGDLMTLGMEYAIKKGETKDSQYFESQLAGFVNNR